MTQKLEVKTINQYFWFFILFHILLWTLIPALVRYALPMDALEGTVWGTHFQLGYDKNPFMNGWLTELALYIGGNSGWMLYLFCQLSVGIALWGVFQLGQKILPPLYALTAVILLEGLQYFNFHAFDFNDNTLELGIWSLLILFYYQAITSNKIRYWLLTGFLAALGMMTKYFIVMLLVPMFLFIFYDQNTRSQFKKPGLYYGLLIFIGISLPHFIWLFFHDFVTIRYAFERVSNDPNWYNHIAFPLKFGWSQLECFIPALLLFLLTLIGKSSNNSSEFVVSKFNRTFLLFIGLAPFLLTELLSGITGISLRAGWGQPLLIDWTLILIALTMPQLNLVRLQRIFICVLGLMVAAGATYTYCLIQAKAPSSANYPGKIIANVLTDKWQTKYNSQLAYVAGPRWVAGNVAFYSKDKPNVYMEWNQKVNPWIDESKLKNTGAVFVWDPEERYQVSYEEIKQRFPTITKQEIMHFTWMRNKRMTPVLIYVAFLPPPKNAIS